MQAVVLMISAIGMDGEAWLGNFLMLVHIHIPIMYIHPMAITTREKRSIQMLQALH